MKFKFSQILLGDKNATYICPKIISTLNARVVQFKHVLFKEDFTLPKMKE